MTALKKTNIKKPDERAISAHAEAEGHLLLPSLSQNEVTILAETFRLLGDPSRLKILLSCVPAPISVGDIAERLDLSVTLVSHHLRLLRGARLVKGDRQGKQIFYEIADRNIDGVILLSGDTHCAELNRIESPHPDGYPLYELVSSPLAQEPTADRNPVGPQEARIRPFYNRAPNAAVVDVDLGAQPPTVTMNIFNEYGHSVWKPLTLTAEELVVTGR